MNRIERWREKCYSDVPVHLYRDLQQFRSRHPYRRLSIAGRDWSYIKCDDGPDAILMLCGSTASGESNWREFPRLSPGFSVLSPSYPAVGSVELLIDGVRAILDAEHIERAHIVGASMGAAIAHCFVRRYPDRVGKLVLISLGLPDEVAATAMKSAVRSFTFVPAFAMRRLFVREAARLVSALPAEEASLMAAYFRDLYRNDVDKRTILGHFRLVAEMASRIRELGLDKPLESDHPVLFINAADDDSFGPEARKAVLDTYPNAQAHLFESGGHTLFGRREELYGIIGAFLHG
jgi:aminoacrylate hydrolase